MGHLVTQPPKNPSDYHPFSKKYTSPRTGAWLPKLCFCCSVFLLVSTTDQIPSVDELFRYLLSKHCFSLMLFHEIWFFSLFLTIYLTKSLKKPLFSQFFAQDHIFGQLQTIKHQESCDSHTCLHFLAPSNHRKHNKTNGFH